MKVLVTGGTGFLGSHLVDALLGQGHEVFAMGRNFQGWSCAAKPIRADLRDRAAVMKACSGMDAVFHAGALSAAWGSKEDFFETNVEGTRRVVDGCCAHGVSRLIYVSSPSVVFDGGDQVCITEDAPYPERFLSMYSLTKKLGEEVVLRAGAQGLPVVIVRPKAIFGPGDRSLLPRLIEVARRGRLPQIGDGSNLVDLTYVDNVVHSLLLALESPRAVGRLYHITNNEHVELWPVIRRLLDRLGLPSHLRHVATEVAMAAATAMEWQARVTGKEPMLTRYTTAILARTQTYDIAAARQDLEYAPLVSVEEGIERTLASLKGKVD